MEEYPSNVIKTPGQPQNDGKIHAPKVVTGTVVQKPKKLTIWDALFDKGNKPLDEYILYDLVIPNLRKGISAVLHGTINQIFGTSGMGAPRTGFWNTGWADDRYYDYTSVSGTTKASRMPQPRMNMTGFDTYVFGSREETERVLNILEELIDVYGWAPASAFYEAINVTPDRTLFNYGWRSLAAAKVETVPDGYIIKLPRPKPIES